MSEPIITINNLKKIFPKAYGKRRVDVLDNVKLTIHKGEFLVILGPSGCGKSTLLRIIAGLEKSTGGEIEYGKSFDKNNINFVFQNFGLLPWLTVSQNVSIGLIEKNIPPHEMARQIDSILEKFGLLSFKDNLPHQLSGGMKQRVGLARAFITKPEIVFLDEPFSELDFFTAKNLREILISMWKEHGTTVVMVSHYVDEAVILADRIAVFSQRPGTIKKIITNELSRPRENRTSQFYQKEDEILGYFEEQK